MKNCANTYNSPLHDLLLDAVDQLENALPTLLTRLPMQQRAMAQAALPLLKGCFPTARAWIGSTSPDLMASGWIALRQMIDETFQAAAAGEPVDRELRELIALKGGEDEAAEGADTRAVDEADDRAPAVRGRPAASV